MNSHDSRDVRSYRLVDGKVVQSVGMPEPDKSEIDADFWLDVAREERRSVFRCHECQGVSHHHPNCPSADDGQDDENDEEGGDE